MFAMIQKEWRPISLWLVKDHHLFIIVLYTLILARSVGDELAMHEQATAYLITAKHIKKTALLSFQVSDRAMDGLQQVLLQLCYITLFTCKMCRDSSHSAHHHYIFQGQN